MLAAVPPWDSCRRVAAAMGWVSGGAWRGVALGRRIRVSSRARGGSPGQKRKAVVHVKGLC
jgi:hypothetical protein